MTYKIGTRVKKVRGVSMVGATGIVSSEPVSRANLEIGCDITVMVDQKGVNHELRVIYAKSVIASRSRHWEPIVPSGHREGKKDLCKPLDHLLTRLKGVEA